MGPAVSLWQFFPLLLQGKSAASSGNALTPRKEQVPAPCDLKPWGSSAKKKQAGSSMPSETAEAQVFPLDHVTKVTAQITSARSVPSPHLFHLQ